MARRQKIFFGLHDTESQGRNSGPLSTFLKVETF